MFPRVFDETLLAGGKARFQSNASKPRTYLFINLVHSFCSPLHFPCYFLFHHFLSLLYQWVHTMHRCCLMSLRLRINEGFFVFFCWTRGKRWRMRPYLDVVMRSICTPWCIFRTNSQTRVIIIAETARIWAQLCMHDYVPHTNASIRLSPLRLLFVRRSSL